MKKTSLLTTILATALFVSAPIALQAAEKAVPSTADNAAGDGIFLHSAAYAGNGEIKFSDLAESRTKRGPVKDFATAMLKDHKEMNRQLKEIADKVKVKLPDDLTAEQKDVLAKLKDASDADFDRMYMDTMVADHKKAIAAFERAATESTHADVKAFATANLAHLKGHLTKAEQVAKSLGSVDAK